MKKTFYFLGLTIFLSSCTDTETSNGNYADSLTTDSVAVGEPTTGIKEHDVNLAELNVWTAFKLTYGTATTDNKKELVCTLKNEGTESYDGYHHIRLDTLVPYTNNGIEYAAAIFNSVKYAAPNATEDGGFVGCHACGAIVGIGLYKKINGTWTNAQSNPIVGNFGVWGEAPIKMSVEIFDQKCFFSFSIGTMAQGYTGGVDQFLWIDERFPISEKRLLEIESYGDNYGNVLEGEDGGFQWEASSKLTKDGNKIYLEVKYGGTDIQDGLVVDRTGKEFYVLNEAKGYFEVER